MKNRITFLSILILSIFLPFASVTANTTGTGQAEVTIEGGTLAIHSFPSLLEFENYTINNNHASQNLVNPFTVAIEDFTGSYAGWSLSLTVNSLMAGTFELNNPMLTTDFSAVGINDADETGAESGSDSSGAGSFTSIDGPVLFDTSKKILSASDENSDVTARHYFNYPADSFELSFLNSTRADTYTGDATFSLVATP